MHLKLIVPHVPGGGGGLTPNLGIITLAALTPNRFEVSIVDENVEELNFDEEVALVGITVMTATSSRSYKTADRYREKGITVVLGGFHPSALPEEAIQHADSVVIGEAEEIWSQLLRDFELGKIKEFYRRKEFANLENLPIPRRDLLKRRSYRLFNTIETTRGCTFNCSFCSVSSHFGNSCRFRPVEDVVKEVKSLKGKYLFFVDDNIVGDPGRTRKLFKALIHCKKKWIGQGSLTFAYNEELVKLAAKSGCIGMFIGFESISQASLREVGKSFNVVKQYGETIKRMHTYEISVHGAFIFGFDNDDKGVFERTVEFINENKLDSVSFSALVPFPGTPLYQKLSKENRIETKDWSKYGGAVFQPKLMSREELNEGCKLAWKECYSFKSIFRRLGPPKRKWFLRFLINMGYKNFVKSL